MAHGEDKLERVFLFGAGIRGGSANSPFVFRPGEGGNREGRQAKSKKKKAPRFLSIILGSVGIELTRCISLAGDVSIG